MEITQERIRNYLKYTVAQCLLVLEQCKMKYELPNIMAAGNITVFCKRLKKVRTMRQLWVGTG